MPGTFTHWLIVHQALELINRDQSKAPLFLLINDSKHWAYIGAQGPDYPYACQIQKKEGAHWADLMHAAGADTLCRTMGEGVWDTLGGREPATREEKALAAWYLGFLSHVVADAFLHPVVAATVGPYKGNEVPHRVCEMVQDTILWSEIRREAPAYGHFLARLTAAQGGSRLPVLLNSCWSHGLLVTYPEAFRDKRPDILDWHKYFLKCVRLRGKTLAVFRHAGGERGLCYRLPEEIPVGDRNRYFEAVRTPRGTSGAFRPLFDRAVAEVAERWWEAYQQITAGRGPVALAFLRDWDLDTGVSLKNPQDGPTYWAESQPPCNRANLPARVEQRVGEIRGWDPGIRNPGSAKEWFRPTEAQGSTRGGREWTIA